KQKEEALLMKRRAVGRAQGGEARRYACRSSWTFSDSWTMSAPRSRRVWFISRDIIQKPQNCPTPSNRPTRCASSNGLRGRGPHTVDGPLGGPDRVRCHSGGHIGRG